MEEEGEEQAGAVQRVAFKKRAKGAASSLKLRAAASSSTSATANESKEQGDRGGSDEEGDEGFDKQSLLDKKLEQRLRQRQPGLDVELTTMACLNKGAKSSITSSSSSLSAGAGSTNQKLHSITGTQFSSRVDSAPGDNPHERIMEEYVQQKLGQQKRKAPEDDEGDCPPGAIASAEDGLYRVPEDLKAYVNTGTVTETEAAIYSGIAEVALPQSFKKRAEEDLQKALLSEQGVRAVASGLLSSAKPVGVKGTSRDAQLLRKFMDQKR